jgi:hypothetical protein
MNSEVRDVLVILDASAGSDVRTRVATYGRVLHRVSSRVVVVRVEDGSIGALAREAGVMRLMQSSAPVDLEGLDENESLFVRGWLLSRQPKTRPAEGRPWDAPGFQPPDKPKGT